MAASTASTSLTDADRWTIAQARELAALSAADARQVTGHGDAAMALGAVLGRAQEHLRTLADLAERLAGE